MDQSRGQALPACPVVGVTTLKDTLTLPFLIKMACSPIPDPASQSEPASAALPPVENHWSLPLSSVALEDPDTRILRLLQVAMKPIQASIKVISSHITAIEKDRAWDPSCDYTWMTTSSRPRQAGLVGRTNSQTIPHRPWPG